VSQFDKILLRFSSPAFTIVFVWVSMIALIALGPIEYPGQPSRAASLVIMGGVSLFLCASWLGTACFSRWMAGRSAFVGASAQALNAGVSISAFLGILGIAFIALDRVVLSGVSNGAYAAMLRCAPELIESIEIKRSPLIYIGYVTFSFGFAALALFLLKGEEIKGWIAYLAQFSIVSAIGYALLYSGRMPILFMIVLIVAVMLARLAQGRSALPSGHYLVLKTIVLVVLFSIYTSAMWSIRRDFCNQMSGLIHQLQEKLKENDPARKNAAADASQKSAGSQMMGPEVKRANSANTISAAELAALIKKNESSVPANENPRGAASELTAVLEQAWHVKPRTYVLTAIDSKRISQNSAVSLLSSYFYLTHGGYIVDLIWQSRAKLTPLWGMYEVGVLSPILRVFFPNSNFLVLMNEQLRLAEIYGFFPSVWGAAFLDFGAIGGAIYIAIWGFLAGLASYGTRHSNFVTPPLLLVFSLATILMSPLQGPLGIANSALVFLSMVMLGLFVDVRIFLRRAD
jgi:hypothetical protein